MRSPYPSAPCPLVGVRPVEPIKPMAVYIVDSEQADGDENEGDWEA